MQVVKRKQRFKTCISYPTKPGCGLLSDHLSRMQHLSGGSVMQSQVSVHHQVYQNGSENTDNKTCHLHPQTYFTLMLTTMEYWQQQTEEAEKFCVITYFVLINVNRHGNCTQNSFFPSDHTVYVHCTNLKEWSYPVQNNTDHLQDKNKSQDQKISVIQLCVVSAFVPTVLHCTCVYIYICVYIKFKLSILNKKVHTSQGMYKHISSIVLGQWQSPVVF